MKIQAFKTLLGELCGLVKLQRLTKIIVVPDHQVAETVNALLELATTRANPYAPGSYAAQAITIPLELYGELFCFIVIAESIVQGLSVARYHTSDAVSAVLEEFLHVWHYSEIWDRRGYIQPSRDGTDLCTADLFVLSSKMHDEYVVGRIKSEILATVPLVDNADDATTVRIMYGDKVDIRLENAFGGLYRTISNASLGAISKSDTWNQLTNIMYRDILEPLGRDSACRYGNEEVPRTETIALQSPFFSQIFSEYWNGIRVQLERTIDTGLRETEPALDEIVTILRSFLAKIGITFQKTVDGICWVNVDRGWLDSLRTDSIR
ncbi:MAG: hypothetical protein SGI88_09955 [Candidatus Hydrogenedentes bacterium]|nr:hypothetical protein [Candidatus Hydrogenedentota bacterium]